VRQQPYAVWSAGLQRRQSRFGYKEISTFISMNCREDDIEDIQRVRLWCGYF
jgi:hypothetical protein